MNRFEKAVYRKLGAREDEMSDVRRALIGVGSVYLLLVGWIVGMAYGRAAVATVAVASVLGITYLAARLANDVVLMVGVIARGDETKIKRCKRHVRQYGLPQTPVDRHLGRRALLEMGRLPEEVDRMISDHPGLFPETAPLFSA